MITFHHFFEGSSQQEGAASEAPASGVMKRPAAKTAKPHGGKDDQKGEEGMEDAEAPSAGSEKLYRPNFYKGANRWGIKRGKREIVSASKLQFRNPLVTCNLHGLRSDLSSHSFCGVKVNEVGGKDLPKEKLQEIIASQLRIGCLSYRSRLLYCSPFIM